MEVVADPALSPAAVAALADPPEPELWTVEANGLWYGVRGWGDPRRPAVLLIHGVTASSAIWWRVGPAIAAALDRRIVAVDQAGHGRTAGWLGHHLFADNAADLVRFAAAAGLAGPGLRIVGHSWGGMTAAAMPGAGLVPEVLVLLDPPVIPVAAIAQMLDDPVEHHYDDPAEAMAAVGGLHPTWSYGDVAAKAEALTQFDEPAVRAILTENGDWDGGLAALDEPAARDARVRLVRGEPAHGSYVSDAAAHRFAERIGLRNVSTVVGGSHAPMRVRPETTTVALIRALEPG